MVYTTFIILATPATDTDMSLWGMVVKGGWLMIPIFILSIIAIYIACERYWLLRKMGINDATFMQKIREYIQNGNTKAVLAECEAEASPLAKTIAKGITMQGETPGEIRQAMEDTANYEVALLEKWSAHVSHVCRSCPHDRLSRNRGRHGTSFLRHGNGRKQYRHHSFVQRYLHRDDHHRGRTYRRYHRTIGL